MQATFVQEGRSIDYTPTSAKSAGDVVVLGSNIIGMVRTPIAANDLGSLGVQGIYDVVKAEEEITVGQDIYWDPDGNPYGGTAGTGAATGTEGDNVFMGVAIAAAGATDGTVRILLAQDLYHASVREVIVPIEDLAAGADIAARPVFVCPDAVTLLEVGILTQGAPAGVDDANTAVIAIADDAGNAIVSKTYNTAAQPPTSDYASLGALSATHKVLTAAEHVTIAVTQGATANLPGFLLVIKYR